jgi:hypothetical protein
MYFDRAMVVALVSIGYGQMLMTVQCSVLSSQLPFKDSKGRQERLF